MTEPAAAPPPEDPPPGLPVLVVDDLHANRHLLVVQLTRFGHKAEAVQDGPAALARLERGGFVAAVIDLRMPGMDGFELARRIRALTGRRGAIGIVGVTAHVQPQQVTLAGKAGMDALLMRPFAPEELDRAVRGCAAMYEPPPALDAEKRAELREALGAERLAALDQAALQAGAAAIAALQGREGAPAAREAADRVAEAFEAIGAFTTVAAARRVAAQPARARLTGHAVLSAMVAVRAALRRG